MANVIDVIIILTLIMGVVLGYKSGFFKSSIEAIGAIAAVILSFYLKNLLAPILFKFCPFFHFSGEFKGLTVLNIILYEVIAFLIIFALLIIVVKVLVELSEKFEKVLDFTIILGIPSKILGGVFGFIEAYCIVFILLFVFAQLSFSAIVLHDSKLTNPILSHTPLLSNITNNSYSAFKEVYNMRKKYRNNKDIEGYNLASLDVMLKYEIVTVDDVKDLKNRGKLQIKGIDNVINKYEVEND